MSRSALIPPDEATVTAYLSNQLPAQSAEAFEIYCLDHPEFARKVELDLAFRNGLRGISQRDLQQQPATHFRPYPAMAAALGALVACGLALLMWSHWHGGPAAYRSAGEVPSQLRQGIQVTATLMRLRGAANGIRQVLAPPNSGVLELKVFPDTPPGRQGYFATITLDSTGGSRSVVLNQLRVDADGYVKVYLPMTDALGRTLRIGLASDPSSSTSAPASFQLEVVASSN